ncbi:helix-turn-helix domain-containing protein [Asticcacaulis benevestitus]|nr:helix-turn-helix domain-containing protein [Asticcacaulis benevestitus]
MIQMARSPKQFGAALQQRRSQKGLSQSALADLIGTGQKTISKIENGNPATKLETLFSLLAALDLELEIKPRSKSNPNEQWEDYL